MAGGAVAVPVIWSHPADGANGTAVASSSPPTATGWGRLLGQPAAGLGDPQRPHRLRRRRERPDRAHRPLLALSLDGSRPFSLQVRTGTGVPGEGLSGFLIGTGELGTDCRRPALVGPASGTAGGLFCVYGSDGRATFRDHTDEINQFDYAGFAAAGSGPAPARTAGEQVDLTLSSVPRSDGTVTLTLRAGRFLDRLAAVAGGPHRPFAGQRDRRDLAGLLRADQGPVVQLLVQNVQSQGQGAVSRPGRGLGPVVGTMFSLSAGVLKMTAQIMPMRLTTSDAITLQVRVGSGWRTVAKAPIGPGWTALLRVEGWDASAPSPIASCTPAAARTKARSRPNPARPG